MNLPPSLRPRADLRPLPGGMTAPSMPTGGSSTNLPRSPRAPMAPRRVKRMKKSRRGSASYMGIPVSRFNCAKIPFPVIASPNIDACNSHKSVMHTVLSQDSSTIAA